MFAKLRGDRRSFDLSDLEGYRLGFVSEINKGMEWDEVAIPALETITIKGLGDP